MIKKGTYFGMLILVGLSYCGCHQSSATRQQRETATDSSRKNLKKTDTSGTTPELWNLQEEPQPDFNLRQVRMLSRIVYDTLRIKIDPDMPDDTVERTFKDLSFFSTDKNKYAVAVAENRGPFYGASYGWCDIFVFKKEKDKWTMTDFMLQAGGGGMYGHPGNFSTLVRTGDHSLAIVLEGGQEHMGGNYHHSLINFENDRLKRLCSISTMHNYGSGAGDDFVYTECDSNKYHFIRNGKAVYDLKIEKYNCLSKGGEKVDEVIIPYTKGYQIPERFNFSS